MSIAAGTLDGTLGSIEARMAQIDSSPGEALDDFNEMLTKALSEATPATQVGPADMLAPAPAAALIAPAATANGVDPALVLAVVENESGFDAHATSAAGACGLMQLMPETAAELGVGNPYDPAQNVDGGCRYLRGLLERFHGNVTFAVAAYNAGPEAVERYGGIPPFAETQRYVGSVLAAYDRYRRL